MRRTGFTSYGTNLVRHPDFLEEFCERKIIESNDKIILNYQNINPATIQKGQLVEVCVEIKAILTKRARWKTIIILSAIVIIRRDIDRAYMKWRLEDTTLPCSRPPLITECKRMWEYMSSEEISVGEEEQRQAKRKEMDGESAVQDQLC
ncbi:hypothetical protein M422DRAFT_264792 [Sphaerobolus stellatus SS14]|uniref:Uncharacterized protein n=1 Tax=Sphaerobolus stellatus (strain SS14) TaxID=990650 RepID=A0A0C9UEL6_SPHS4|nr:hypothetical protein M422DRAFT_264792 [Sphaerobolus stellatus SS14]